MARTERQLNKPASLDLELQDIRSSPPSRQPTLQAHQHARRPRYEDYLFAASKLQPKKGLFWADYNHLSHRSHAPVASLFYLIVKKRTQPPDTLKTIECDPGDETCLSDWLEEIHEALGVQSSDSIMLW